MFENFFILFFCIIYLFFELQYPKSFIQCAKIKAFKIYKPKCFSNISINKFSNNNLFHIYILFYPIIQLHASSEKNPNNLAIQTVTNFSKTIRNIINNKKSKNHIN